MPQIFIEIQEGDQTHCDEGHIYPSLEAAYAEAVQTLRSMIAEGPDVSQASVILRDEKRQPIGLLEATLTARRF